MSDPRPDLSGEHPKDGIEGRATSGDRLDRRDVGPPEPESSGGRSLPLSAEHPSKDEREVVEAAAAAMWETGREPNPLVLPWDETRNENGRDETRRIARAALTAAGVDTAAPGRAAEAAEGELEMTNREWAAQRERDEARQERDSARLCNDEALRQLAEAIDRLVEFVEWFRENDGKANDFGRLFFVARAESFLQRIGREPAALSDSEDQVDPKRPHHYRGRGGTAPCIDCGLIDIDLIHRSLLSTPRISRDRRRPAV